MGRAERPTPGCAADSRIDRPSEPGRLNVNGTFSSLQNAGPALVGSSQVIDIRS